MIIVVYIDDLNIVETQKEIDDVRTLMKEEFETKDIEKKKFYLKL